MNQSDFLNGKDAFAAIFKSWWQPSFTLGVAATKSFTGDAPRLGITLSVEQKAKAEREFQARARQLEEEAVRRSKETEERISADLLQRMQLAEEKLKQQQLKAPATPGEAKS